MRICEAAHVPVSWLRSDQLITAFDWAAHSTANALQRLADVQEHRAKLFKLAKDLDDAYHRLERSNHMLAMARADAEEARQAANQFALTVSHELRTPLNVVIGFSELMVNSPSIYTAQRARPKGLYSDISEIYRSSSHLHLSRIRSRVQDHVAILAHAKGVINQAE